MLIPWTELMILAMALAGAGLFAGFVAGLFGIGGGTVMVPALLLAFASLGYDGPRAVHVAVGTSLAVITLTAIRSLRAHRHHGAVDEQVLRDWRIPVMVGAMAGALLAGLATKATLGIIYAVLSLLVAGYLGLLREGYALRPHLPGRGGQGVMAGSIGAASAMMGVGGGAFGSAALSLCGMPIHRAIATASGLGGMIAAPAAVVYLLLHGQAAGRPPLSFGDVNLPAVVVLASFSALTAPVGARLAHRLERRMLRRIFAVYMVMTALYVIWRSAV